MSIKNVEDLLNIVNQTIEENKAKEKLKPGTMSLLSMFRYAYENSHSEVLRYLLDPKADHRHNEEYLRLFLKEIGFGDLCVHDLTQCTVYRERAKIDLYIEHPEFAIIIENKIYAGDQWQQLKRYYLTVKDEWKVPKEKIRLCYLTRTGYEPSEQSIGGEDDADTDTYKELLELRERENNKFIDISYSYHVLRWLKQLSFKSNEHTLRSAVEQYIYNVEIITGQTEKDKDMTKEILNLVIKSDIANIDEQSAYALRNALNICLSTNIAVQVFYKLQAKKNELKSGHKVVLTFNNAKVCSTIKEFNDKLLESSSEKYIHYGIGIQLADNMSVAMEYPAWNKNLKYGLMGHTQDPSEYTQKMKNCFQKGKFEQIDYDTDNKYWYFSKELKPSMLSVDEIVEKLMELYDQISD